MSFTGQRRGRTGYHHGDLREALIAAALDLIASRGLAGLALAELARAAGVSPAAPYRHFRDRAAVLAEIARRGFGRFEQALQRALDASPAPSAVLGACARAHLAFARADAALYAAMYDRDPSAENDSVVAEAADRAFAVLRRAAELACAAQPATSRPPALMVALHVWSLTHGIATLAACRPSQALGADDLLEAGLLIYTGSLGIGGSGPAKDYVKDTAAD